jgi:hypothetical protein
MKFLIGLLGAGFALILITAAFLEKGSRSKTPVQSTNTSNGIAVVELFTSEGCSSCPPADAALARIQQEAGNKPVFVLVYHVDYWNRLGWKDQFSNPQYSKRQYQYSRQFTSQVYTPQVIVNGQQEFVGSEEAAVRNAVADGLNNASNVSISLKGQPQAGKMKIYFHLTGNVNDNQLLIAVVEKNAVSKVLKGENQGRTLHHAQIVHSLYAFDLKQHVNGFEQFELPAGFNAGGWEIVGFLQDPGTGVINAASRANLIFGNSGLSSTRK